MLTRLLVLLAVLLVPASAPSAAPRSPEPSLHPSRIPGSPSYVQRVEPAIVGVRVRVRPDRPSAATLGTQRFASAVVFDQAGYAVTVSYALLDAESLEAQLRNGTTVRARAVG